MSAPRRRWSFSLRTLLIVVAVPFCCVGLHGLYLYAIQPAAVNAFWRHRALLEQVVQLRKAGGPPGDLEALNKLLQKTAFTSVREEGVCTVFYHSGFMPAVDNWHEVVYCPGGHRDLPDYRRGEYNRLHELRALKSERRITSTQTPLPPGRG